MGPTAIRIGSQKLTKKSNVSKRMKIVTTVTCAATFATRSILTTTLFMNAATTSAFLIANLKVNTSTLKIT